MSGPKEDAYDEHISPLVAQIIALCKEHEINAFAQFHLDYDEEQECNTRCTTYLPLDSDDEEGTEACKRFYREFVKPRGTFLTMTITSTKPTP